MPPLRITAYSIACAAGIGRSALPRRCAIAADCGRTISANRRCRPGSAACRASRTSPLPRPTSADWDCRNNRLAWLALTSDGFLELRPGGRRSLRRRSRRAGARHLHLEHRGDRGGLPARCCRTASTPRTCAARSCTRRTRWAISCARRSGSRASRVTVAHGVLVERQGVRAGGAAACASGSLTRRSSAASTRSAAACCSASTRWNSCRPSPADRSIARGAASASAKRGGFALLERDGEQGPWLLGYGESSDAHHMSSPHPEGLGARLAMRGGAGARRVDGRTPSTTSTCTARRARRTTKSRRGWSPSMFPARTLASSTKGWTGHTLGAAGIVEAVITFARDGDWRWCPAR